MLELPIPNLLKIPHNIILICAPRTHRQSDPFLIAQYSRGIYGARGVALCTPEIDWVTRNSRILSSSAENSSIAVLAIVAAVKQDGDYKQNGEQQHPNCSLRGATLPSSPAILIGGTHHPLQVIDLSKWLFDSLMCYSKRKKDK
jgi:hypothetical protein